MTNPNIKDGSVPKPVLRYSEPEDEVNQSIDEDGDALNISFAESSNETKPQYNPTPSPQPPPTSPPPPLPRPVPKTVRVVGVLEVALCAASS